MTESLRARLDRFGLRPNKRLGQNFLHDQHALETIAKTVEAEGPTSLVEIGPGPGTLSDRLVALGRPMVAVEKDRGLAELLRDHFSNADNFSLVEGDILEQDLGALSGDTKPVVVGNIPYNISSPILLALIRQRAALGPVVLMLQAELAERLRARVGSRAGGSLTVLLQQLADVEKVLGLAPGAFFPPPKVRSEVIRIRWLDRPRAPVGDLDFFERVVRTGFGQRRKTLRNALKVGWSVGVLARVELAVEMDLTRRAETLEIAEWARLSEALRATAALAQDDV